jgi:hypothetical protein
MGNKYCFRDTLFTSLLFYLITYNILQITYYTIINYFFNTQLIPSI